MIVFSDNWTPLKMSLEQFIDIAHDSIMPVEFVYQNGEIKVRINSPKFFNGGNLQVTDEEKAIPYCLHLSGIESLAFSSEGGHPEIYIVDIEWENGEFRILGSNGEMSFKGENIEIEFLRDDQSFSAAEALKEP